MMLHRWCGQLNVGTSLLAVTPSKQIGPIMTSGSFTLYSFVLLRCYSERSKAFWSSSLDTLVAFQNIHINIIFCAANKDTKCYKKEKKKWYKLYELYKTRQKWGWV